MKNKNKQNQYTDILSDDFFRKCPKAVFAAIAISWAHLQGTDLETENIEGTLIGEWNALYHNGIVPQKPYK